MCSPCDPSVHQVTLIPHWAGGKHGYLYDVLYRDEIIVRRSPDPGFDACRVLQARNLLGRLQVLDIASGRVRFTVRVERGSQLATREDRKQMYFGKFQRMPVRLLPKWKAR